MDSFPQTLDDLIAYVQSQHPDASPLEHLADAVLAADYIGDLADHLIGHFVDQARHAGASWTEVGQSLGVSKQAAQKRFVPREPDEATPPTARVFSRFTDRARNVIVQAQEEARQAANVLVEPAHLVLGLTHEPDALAGRALQALGVGPDRLRAAALATLAPAQQDVPEHIPFSAQSKKLLELTTREAFRLGHNYVGTEHILLGLLSEEGAAGQILSGLGLSRHTAEEWIVAALAEIRRKGQAG